MVRSNSRIRTATGRKMKTGQTIKMDNSKMTRIMGTNSRIMVMSNRNTDWLIYNNNLRGF